MRHTAEHPYYARARRRTGVSFIPLAGVSWLLVAWLAGLDDVESRLYVERGIDPARQRPADLAPLAAGELLYIGLSA